GAGYSPPRWTSVLARRPGLRKNERVSLADLEPYCLQRNITSRGLSLDLHGKGCVATPRGASRPPCGGDEPNRQAIRHGSDVRWNNSLPVPAHLGRSPLLSGAAARPGSSAA